MKAQFFTKKNIISFLAVMPIVAAVDVLLLEMLPAHLHLWPLFPLKPYVIYSQSSYLLFRAGSCTMRGIQRLAYQRVSLPAD